MEELRKRLAEFQDEGDKIYDALGDREWPSYIARKEVKLLRDSLKEVHFDLEHVIVCEEAWEEES